MGRIRLVTISTHATLYNDLMRLRYLFAGYSHSLIFKLDRFCGTDLQFQSQGRVSLLGSRLAYKRVCYFLTFQTSSSREARVVAEAFSQVGVERACKTIPGTVNNVHWRYISSSSSCTVLPFWPSESQRNNLPGTVSLQPL